MKGLQRALVVIGTLFWLIQFACAQSECGDFYKLKSDDVGYLYSPGFPKPYPVNSFCIWLIEAPEVHNVRLIVNFQGEMYNDTCSDYLEIRLGSRDSALVDRFCDKAINLEFVSSSRWFWLMFRSDRINGSGTPMMVEFSAVRNESRFMNTTCPYSGCRSYEFVCRNQECQSMSYRCDGHNDCGCLKDCDESLCEGLSISKQTQVIIALLTGFGSFCILCLITYCIEGKNNWIASQAEALREREITAEKQRQRASRAFTKFIGGEKELLLNVPKSRMNLTTARLSTASIRY